MGISQPGIIALPRLLAVEVLLSEPESLGDDVLEACLYILRDRLRGEDVGDASGGILLGRAPDPSGRPPRRLGKGSLEPHPQ